MKLHILSNPHQPTTLNYRSEPFSVLVHKFISNLSNKFEMIHYGIPGASVECESVDLPIGDAEWNAAASHAISRNKSPDDMILCFYGSDNKAAVEAHSDLKIIEPSIGYNTAAVFAPYRVFASYAIMHYYYGTQGMLMNPSWFDSVIPNPITPSEFEYREEKDDYYLCFGRVSVEKGIHLCIQMTQAANKKLIIAGPGSTDNNGNPSLQHLGYESIPKHVEVLGYCTPEKRKELMSNAKAVLAPTHYIEPFGNMVAEALFCGTPVITTDWGGFVDTNIHGVTGVRCRTFNDFVEALTIIDTIKSVDCYTHAMENFADEVVYSQYIDYLLNVHDGRFYQS